MKNQSSLEKWVLGRIPNTQAGVRVDCYASVVPSYMVRFPEPSIAWYEFLTQNPYKPRSPLTPHGDLTHAAFAASGRWAPDWTQKRYDAAYLVPLQTPVCQERIKVLHEIAKTKIVFLVGLMQNPRILGRTLVKHLIENAGD